MVKLIISVLILTITSSIFVKAFWPFSSQATPQPSWVNSHGGAHWSNWRPEPNKPANIYDANVRPECRYTRAAETEVEYELQRLHILALKENRTLQSLEGGDEVDDMDGVRDAFQAKFPCISVNLSVDLSKYHDVRIDRELRSGQPLTFDVAHLQTVHDFYRWKDEGVLLQFRPMGSDWVYNNLKDTDGYFTALNLITFSHYTKKSEPNKPTKFQDYLHSRWRGKIVMTYPHDDDAVLYQFYLAMQQNPEFVEQLVAQNVNWVRGTGTPLILIDRNQTNARVTFSTANDFNNTNNRDGQFTLPKAPEQFLTWGQLAAIFKRAPSPNTAKLYLTWWLTQTQQNDWFQWGSRWDINNRHKRGLSIYDYPNTNPTDFISFMRNRELVNELIEYMNRVIGPVVGDSPLVDDVRN